MSVPRLRQPPAARGSYVIPQLEGEIISIPGSKSVFRILTSAMQTDGKMSIFSSGGALADAPGFHHHNEAHDIFIVTKGFLQLWNGDKCRILGPGDFASIPPGIIHNPKLLGPVTETFGVITPGDWIDFFRYICETYDGILYPENDDRNLLQHLIPKLQQAQERYDVHFHQDHKACEVGEWTADDERLPAGTEPYYLRANTGPRWMLGGVMSRPFITTKQSGGKFAICSIESSSRHEPSALSKKLTFPKVHHCFTVFEGAITLSLEGLEPCTIREGEAIFIAANTPFSIDFVSKFCRMWSFASGDGIEMLIHEAGKRYEGFILPDCPLNWEKAAFKAACDKYCVK